MASTGIFTNALNKLKNTGLAGNQNPYAPSGQDPQPTDGHIETPVDMGIHVDNPYAPQRDPQPTDGPSAMSPYKPPSMGRQILGALVGGLTKNPNLTGAITGDSNLERQKEALGLQQQQAQTELTRQQGSMVEIPGPSGPIMMPMALAKAYLPVQAREQGAANVANINVGGRENVAQTGAAARTGAAQIGANARVEAAKMNLGPTADVPQDLQDQFGLPSQLPLSQLNRAETAAGKPLTIVQGANGPSEINKFQNAPAPGQGSRNLGLGAPAMSGVIQVGDVNNPGNTVIETKQQAVRQGAPGIGSASVQVPRQAEKAAVPTNIGNQTVAFKTMIDHAGLLRQAAQALGNGNVQALNGLKNSFKTQFGYSGPITAQAIADAYNAEVAGVLNKGHITDKDLGTTAKTLDVSKMSPQQMDSVLASYQALGQRKMKNLHDVTNAAVQASQSHGGNSNPSVDDLVSKYGGR